MAMLESDALTSLEESTRDAHRVQLETLGSILAANAGTGYLLRHRRDSSSPIDAESFRRLVPLSSYSDYAALIHRIADGDEPPSALSSAALLCFFYSSGTDSSTPKLIPFFDSHRGRSATGAAQQASAALLRRLFPPRPDANKILWFLYAGGVTETRGGYRVMPASAYPFHAGGPARARLLAMCASPPEVILGLNTHLQTYCHLLCGLRSSGSIHAMRAPYAAGLVRAMRVLEKQWRQLCDDIESGSVGPEITDGAMRGAVDAYLGSPQPELAERIRGVCRRERWGGIVAELWPELRYVACVTTGSMQQCCSTLKYYIGESIPLLGSDYFASECSIGINMDRIRPPEATRYVIIPAAAYFEFLPFELGAQLGETVDISGVEVGKMYEVVVTSYRGLYRYRLGDIVKVVGFYNSSPEVEFVARAPKETMDVFTERELMDAMESFQLMLGDEGRGGVVDYAVFLSSEEEEKHLVVFLELSKDCSFMMEGRREEAMGVLASCCTLLEGCLGGVYKVRRGNGELGPIEVCVVGEGSFDGLASVALEGGAPANQYKPPKIIRNLSFVKLLRASVVLSNFKGE